MACPVDRSHQVIIHLLNFWSAFFRWTVVVGVWDLRVVITIRALTRDLFFVYLENRITASGALEFA